MAYYVVRANDHLASIAFRRGLAADAIWGRPENEALRALRGSGAMLRAGDILFLPDPPETRPLEGQAGTTNAFQAAIPRTTVRLTLRGEGGPMANQAYRIETPGETLTGTTDGDGRLTAEVRVSTPVARLFLEGRGESYTLHVGGMDPPSETTGIQQRLRQLGLLAKEADGVLDGATREALRRFQAARGLTETGEPSGDTLRELSSEYGS